MQTDFCKLKYVYSIMFIYAMLYKFRLTAAVICLIIIVRYCWSIRVIFMAIDHLQGKKKVKEIRI